MWSLSVLLVVMCWLQETPAFLNKEEVGIEDVWIDNYILKRNNMNEKNRSTCALFNYSSVVKPLHFNSILSILILFRRFREALQEKK